MRFVFVCLPAFVVNWRRLGLADDDLRSLENEVMDHPSAGPVMAGAGGLRKIRFAPPSWHTGKSGALRVCYATFFAHSRVYFVTAFGKNVKANLTRAERNAVAGLLRRIGDALDRGEQYV